MIPKRSADYIEINGEKFWVQTLNELQKKNAAELATRAARADIAHYSRKDSEGYKDVRSEIESLSVDEQAVYYANTVLLSGNVSIQVMEKWPDRYMPERQDNETDEKYQARVEEYEQYMSKLEENRQAEEDSIIESLKKEALAMTKRNRLESCYKAFMARILAEKFVEHFILYTLLEAVRDPDDHKVRIFSSVNEVYDLDDEVRSALYNKYSELDSVKPNEIPT